MALGSSGKAPIVFLPTEVDALSSIELDALANRRIVADSSISGLRGGPG
jgi:hypothetical protein